MQDYQNILEQILSDERYQRNIDWGEQRKGHPEGTVRGHIAELERNLDSLRDKFTTEDQVRLQILIHTHDSFKGDAKQGVPITHPESHASLAAAFLAEYCEDSDLLNMVQFHDEPYALWKKQLKRGDISERLRNLVSLIDDWNLFLGFLIIDGCTEGKSRDPLNWFFDVITGLVESTIQENDLL